MRHIYILWDLVSILLEIWRYFTNAQRSGNTKQRRRAWANSVQVRTCCLMKSSHYLDQCWLVLYDALQQSREDNIVRNTEDIDHLKRRVHMHFVRIRIGQQYAVHFLGRPTGNGLVPTRTSHHCANVDQDFCRYMVSLAHNWLTHLCPVENLWLNHR